MPASEELVSQELHGASYLQLPQDSKIIQQAFAVFDRIFS
jgi:hypothetical protein